MDLRSALEVLIADPFGRRISPCTSPPARRPLIPFHHPRDPGAMVQPNLAPSQPKKKKVAKNPTPKQQAREKYQKTLQKFKVRDPPPNLNAVLAAAVESCLCYSFRCDLSVVPRLFCVLNSGL